MITHFFYKINRYFSPAVVSPKTLDQLLDANLRAGRLVWGW